MRCGRALRRCQISAHGHSQGIPYLGMNRTSGIISIKSTYRAITCSALFFLLSVTSRSRVLNSIIESIVIPLFPFPVVIPHETAPRLGLIANGADFRGQSMAALRYPHTNRVILLLKRNYHAFESVQHFFP